MVFRPRHTCGSVRRNVWLLFVSAVALLFTIAVDATGFDDVLYTNHWNRRAVYLTANGTEPCQVYGQTEDISTLVTKASRVRKVHDDELQTLIDKCHGHVLSRGKRDAGNRLDFIYPGTKWCGPGNVAANYDDLGLYADTDRCCREHDLCPEYILSGDCKYGLCNTSPFTRSHCNCDENFRQCLTNVNTPASNAVGVAFFNVGNIVCFRNDYPIIGCNRYVGKRRKRQVQCSPTAQLWRFVSPAEYRTPGKVEGRSMGRGMDGLGIPSRSTGVMSSLHDLIDTVGDVSTVVRSVAKAAIDTYRWEQRTA